MTALRFALDAGPGSWAAAQEASDSARLSKAVARTIEVARIADRAGLDSLFVLEDPDGWDAFGVLNAIAAVTERIRLGTGVTNPYYRHPSLIAASVSTLDLISNGRAFLGLGRGQSEWYAHGMGMPYGKPVARLIETIDLLRQWFQPPYSATSPDDATEFGLNNWRRVIHPVQSHVPIYLAAVGARALNVAARHAEGVIFNDLASREFMREAVETVRAGAAAAGRDPATIEFYARAAVTVTNDPEAIYERRKDTVAIIHTLPGMERLLTTQGFDIERIIADVRRVMRTEEILARGGNFADLREGGDLAAAKKQIPNDLMKELLVAGSADHVRQRLREFEEIGITHVFLSALSPTDTLETLESTLSAIAGRS
jgi:5,10-methylenetetrahydromethanopterin reductase